ncbi:Chemotaxis protein MotB [Thalassovita gelatinovora]|uniref:Chemotaxis protein MotB n=1 Tax=Thalassovita gelatinovora TaxID=53501 RepID=A0A0N7LUU3_THAGE|nr:peptidoglycan -binding protein [Thalassovita gelatinovora]QIZ81352.1 peptidoglycan -binding protein [Thalassovita gelatinovora]CUH64458.1 Chemotaxis protein MotB [Thalassovita gelatinovora]SEP98320.1 chemotaxis protein MotB [Thalassovita gelatinovora]
MALSRRTGQRFQSSIWPGFVDAMTGLLLVLMFVLTIFMVVQFVLRETISGQESELDSLSVEIAALADALGLEKRRSAQLTERVGELDATLSAARQQAETREALIASLTVERDNQAAALADANLKITDFEARVTALLAQREEARGSIAALQQEQADLIDEREALNLALAQARNEIDAGAEAARLAAAKREALAALIADLQAQNKDVETANATLSARVETLQNELSEEETARLTEAAAAEALREKLKNADAELTAITLSLDEQRRKAEETLTLLAAADAARIDLTAKLTEALAAKLTAEEQAELARQARAAAEQEAANTRAAMQQDETALQQELARALAAKLAAEQASRDSLSEAERQAVLAEAANKMLSQAKAQSTEAQRQQALLNQQLAAMRTQLSSLQALLDDYKERDSASNVRIENLGSDLNAALARAAAEERKRRLLEEAERLRLEQERQQLTAEKKDLEQYRSEFFGRMRELLSEREGVRIVGDRFVFSSEVLFASGSADLSPEGAGEIANVASILREIAGDIPKEIDWIIRVDGHTDDRPIAVGAEFADNWELSQARALSVVRFMVQNLGIPPNRLSANGFGQYQPVNPDDTPEARAQNRRIELKLTER